MANMYKIRTGENIYQVAEWPGEKTTIIGVHGITGNCLNLSWLGEGLSPQYRFISYDLRGRGNSSPAEDDSTIQTHAEDLLSFIEKMQIDKPFIIGFSIGAYIAAKLASISRELSGIILLDGGAVVTENDRAGIEAALNRLDKTFPTQDQYLENIKKSYLALGVNWTENVEAYVLHEIAYDGKRYTFRGQPRSLCSDLDSMFHFDHDAILPKIESPVLLIYCSAERDPILFKLKEDAYTKTRGLIANLEYYVFGYNHFTVVLNKQPELISVIKDFIAKNSFNECN